MCASKTQKTLQHCRVSSGIAGILYKFQRTEALKLGVHALKIAVPQTTRALTLGCSADGLFMIADVPQRRRIGILGHHHVHLRKKCYDIHLSSVLSCPAGIFPPGRQRISFSFRKNFQICPVSFIFVRLFFIQAFHPVLDVSLSPVLSGSLSRLHFRQNHAARSMPEALFTRKNPIRKEFPMAECRISHFSVSSIDAILHGKTLRPFCA